MSIEDEPEEAAATATASGIPFSTSNIISLSCPDCFAESGLYMEHNCPGKPPHLRLVKEGEERPPDRVYDTRVVNCSIHGRIGQNEPCAFDMGIFPHGLCCIAPKTYVELDGTTKPQTSTREVVLQERVDSLSAQVEDLKKRLSAEQQRVFTLRRLIRKLDAWRHCQTKHVADALRRTS